MPGKIEKANLQPTHKCSFCGIDDKSLKGVMIAGPGVSICSDCVKLCVDIVFEKFKEAPGEQSGD
ncbi:ClpX C4-type zinc finger protein [Enterobacter asburiae]|uniref:ClpX C4-type zinc finger protein n=1 Tax=Enterobacter asburiae TaxID=61645 RepID=A0AAW7ZQY1_ENTAS|nr:MULTISPECIES: ClpX C4-type zinc finger protein [Enterobacter cloacae complex]MDO7924035.1 ClpX C4-type zinc finger protein [Enterobacter asburiae]MDV0916405.1 ClpX C4-type zinc finger protein [Enterobacter asburiae]MDV0936351.1 ClpX C4-type zinc finger protein [Enterobacter asburiae]MDV0947208.1 ClpX C4-type zinc finger protein [Enterobacter asburiae]MDV0993288.1 ClpX C4-type zinc finger protein [Enterobacter asburiae]